MMPLVCADRAPVTCPTYFSPCHESASYGASPAKLVEAVHVVFCAVAELCVPVCPRYAAPGQVKHPPDHIPLLVNARDLPSRAVRPCKNMCDMSHIGPSDYASDDPDHAVLDIVRPG